MTNVISPLNVIQIILFLITILLAIIYLIPILSIRRFHSINNIFTINICLAAIFACCYWLSYYIILELYTIFLSESKVCIVFNYFEMMCTFQMPLAVVVASVHRCCSIVYHTKPFFKKKQWAVTCIASQWIIGIVFSIPRIPFFDPVRYFHRSKN